MCVWVSVGEVAGRCAAVGSPALGRGAFRSGGGKSSGVPRRLRLEIFFKYTNFKKRFHLVDLH